jgi:hypothetical protein
MFAMPEHFLRNLLGRLGCEAFFAKLDEPCILSKAASVKVERDAVALADRAHGANIFHRDGLAAAGVIGDGQHDQRNPLPAHALDERFKRGHIHVAFERMLQGRLPAFRNDKIDRFGADEFNVGTRRIEVGIVGDDIAFLAHHSEENPLSGSALMRGNHVRVAADVLDRIAKTIEAAAARVALVALHDGGPLMRRHGASARIRQQVDQHIVGLEKEKIVVRGLDQLFTLRPRGPADRLDALDAEGLDDGLDRHTDSKNRQVGMPPESTSLPRQHRAADPAPQVRQMLRERRRH